MSSAATFFLASSSNFWFWVQATFNTVIDISGDKELSETEKNKIISDCKEVTNDKLSHFSLYKKPEGSPEHIDIDNFPQAYGEMEEVIKYGQVSGSLLMKIKLVRLGWI